jgi:hypothetical protein
MLMAKNARYEDRTPWLRLLPSTVVIVAICGYSAIEGPGREDSLATAVMNPALFAGRELRLPSNTRVLQVLPRGIEVAQRRAQVTVHIPEDLEREWRLWKEQVQAGDYVSLRAVFHPEGYLVLQEMHIHEGRQLKIWVSVLALLLLAGVIIRENWR